MINDYSDRYINRELSWLQFNARVLQEAGDVSVPLIERLRFLGIFSNNLDEFFKVRYATVKRIDRAGKKGRSYLGGIKASDLLSRITQIVIAQQSESRNILKGILKQLKSHDIHMIDELQLSDSQIDFVRNYFNQTVSPAITTIMINDVDSAPYLRDAAGYLSVRMEMKSKDEHGNPEVKHAIIEMPKSLKRFVVLPNDGTKQYIIHVDDIIRHRLHYIFHMFDYKTIEAHMIKVTRDAELDLDNDLKKSFIDKITKGVKSRDQGHPVRFVYDDAIHEDSLSFLMELMEIEDKDSIIPGGRYHNRRDYMKFPDLGKTGLLYKREKPVSIPDLEQSGSIIEKIAQRDYLQYTPYHSFSHTLKFLREAALDPTVTDIYITIYRLANMSQVVASLVNAARNGKNVVVEIELKARFDEQNNIISAEELQNAGATVIFGVPGLKVHCKSCVIIRNESDGTRKRYGFFSTGNFNESTARFYTDYTLFTANQEILKELVKVFAFFETNYRVSTYKHLIVSPHYTRNRLNVLIDNEIAFAKAGKPAKLRIKLNSLSDFKMIDKLYEANKAGVQIELIVRGICSLIPGIQGMSENIQVISVVDKYLEHPRVYYFENDGDPIVYISSADFMPRNLDKRVEIACPIYDEYVKKQIIDTMDICWKDNVKARIVNDVQDNQYVRNRKMEVRSQVAQYEYLKALNK